MMPAACELELKGITKRFGNTVANDNVSFCIRKGEVIALVGENGAGKSTLMNIMYGMLQPDEGQILYRGKPITLRSPSNAIALGIGMVHQHFMLSPSLTVAENIVLGYNPGKEFFWNPSKFDQEIAKLQEEFDIQVPLHVPVSELSVGKMQRVEIIKALYRKAEILILDEPTAVLTPQEATELFNTIRKLTANGKTVVFISHKLREIMEIADRIVALRGGKIAGSAMREDVTIRDIARMMIGADIKGIQKGQQEKGEVLLQVKDLCYDSETRQGALDHVSFELHAGEILGVAGVEGNGQTELAEALIGVLKPSSGTILMRGRDITKDTVTQRLHGGMAHIPQDRMTEGLALNLSIAKNVITGRHNRKEISEHGIMKWNNVNAYAKELIGQYSIKANSEQDTCGSLSGGNMQKIVVARELSAEPDVVIACQPTRGVDIGSSEYIRQSLENVRANGGTVLLISADLDEIMDLSDRIMVMYNGRKSGEVNRADANETLLGEMMFADSREDQHEEE